MTEKDKSEILNNTILKINEVLEKNKHKKGIEEAYQDIQMLMQKRNLESK